MGLVVPIIIVWAVVCCCQPPSWVTPRKTSRFTWLGLHTMSSLVAGVTALIPNPKFLLPILVYVFIVSTVTDLWWRKVLEPWLYFINLVTLTYYTVEHVQQPQLVGYIWAFSIIFLLLARTLTMFAADVLLVSTYITITLPVLLAAEPVLLALNTIVATLLLVVGFLTFRERGFPAAPFIGVPFLACILI